MMTRQHEKFAHRQKKRNRLSQLRLFRHRKRTKNGKMVDLPCFATKKFGIDKEEEEKKKYATKAIQQQPLKNKNKNRKKKMPNSVPRSKHLLSTVTY